MVFTASLLGAQQKKGESVENKLASLVVVPRHLTGLLHLYVADRWRTHTSPGYNCEVANPARRKRRLLGT